MTSRIFRLFAVAILSLFSANLKNYMAPEFIAKVADYTAKYYAVALSHAQDVSKYGMESLAVEPLGSEAAIEPEEGGIFVRVCNICMPSPLSQEEAVEMLSFAVQYARLAVDELTL